jgi:uncharacterized membrane protein
MLNEQASPTLNEEASMFSLNLWTLSLVVLFLALGVSIYLSYDKLADVEAVCVESGRFDCGTVLNSAYSEFAGIPIAVLGLATNVMLIGLLLLEPRSAFFAQNGPTLVFGLNLFTFLFSVYLVYLQAFVILAYCVWCLTHEALVFTLFAFSCIRLWRSLRGEL